MLPVLFESPSTVRRPLALAIVGVSLVSAAAVLALWPGRIGREHVLVAAAAAWTVCGLAARWGSSRQWKGFVASLPLVLLAVAGGAGARIYRDYRARSPSLISLVDRSLPELASRPASLDALLEHFRKRPKKDLWTLQKLEPEELKTVSERALGSVFALGDHDAAQLPEDLSWNEDPFGDRKWQWYLHTMDFVAALTQRHEETHDMRYLHRAADLVLDWSRDNVRYLYTPPSRFSWHDHVTALRVRAWLPFFEEWVKSPLADAAGLEEIVRAIAVHGQRLADPAFYTESHNHGIEQDIALLAISVGFPELSGASAWKDLAVARLTQQISDTVSPNGVHLEHSPGYHIFTLAALTHARDFAVRHGVQALAQSLDPVLGKMARFAAYAIQPDGRVVLVGDTSYDVPLTLGGSNVPHYEVLARYADTDPVLRFALTRGKEGTPGEDAIVFEKEGYAILRDAWSPPGGFEQSLYIFFTAAANAGRAHKQADDLSFVLSAGGRELLIDSGHFGYDMADPARQYVVDARAHNTIVVDGKGFSGFDARLEAHAFGKRFAAVQASHDNYPGLRHRRTLIYLRPATIYVVDEVRGRPAGAAASPAQHTFEQLFHFAPELDIEVNGSKSGLAAVPHGEPPARAALRLDALADGRGAIEVVKGAKDPLQGWVSRMYLQLQPAPVAKVFARGAEATFVTRIEIAAKGEPGSTQAEEPSCKVEEDRISIRWNAAGASHTLEVARGGVFEVLLRD